MFAWLLVPIAIGVAVAVAYIGSLLRKRRLKSEKEGGEEDEKNQQKERHARKISKVTQVLSADPLLAKELLKLAEYPDMVPGEITEKIRIDITKKIDDTMLEILLLAAVQRDIDFDLRREVYTESVLYPTRRVEITPLGDVTRLLSVLPEQLVMDDDLFFESLVSDQLFRFDYQQSFVRKKRLYILIDVSGSMESPMDNGLRRDIWSRGVAASLLVKAVRGEAQYLLRIFANSTGDLKKVFTPEEAEAMLEWVLKYAGGQQGGTHIFVALKQAVQDIRKQMEEDGSAEADLLLISDGGAGGTNDSREEREPAKLRELLGDKIRLHFAAIDQSERYLEQVATTHRIFK